MLFHGVAFLSWNQHPEPTGSRRATPLLHFQHSAGHPPAAALAELVTPALVKHVAPFALVLGPDPNSVFGRVLIEATAGVFAGLAFVEVGARIAPRDHQKVARVLAVINLAIVAVATLGNLVEKDYWALWQGLCAALAAFAAADAIGREEIHHGFEPDAPLPTEARPPGVNSNPNDELSAQEKLAQATADYEKWSRVAAKPGLSPAAATWARNAARSAKAEVMLRRKAAAYEAQNPAPTEKGT